MRSKRRSQQNQICIVGDDIFLILSPNLPPAFKLLSNAPVTKITVEDTTDGSSAAYDRATTEHNEKQRAVRHSSPSSSDLDKRRAQFDSVAVDSDWVKLQSNMYWVGFCAANIGSLTKAQETVEKRNGEDSD